MRYAMRNSHLVVRSMNYQIRIGEKATEPIYLTTIDSEILGAKNDNALVMTAEPEPVQFANENVSTIIL
jgi:hypothetical protein